MQKNRAGGPSDAPAFFEEVWNLDHRDKIHLSVLAGSLIGFLRGHNAVAVVDSSSLMPEMPVAYRRNEPISQEQRRSSVRFRPKCQLRESILWVRATVQ
jgi:hypothetical protein